MEGPARLRKTRPEPGPATPQCDRSSSPAVPCRGGGCFPLQTTPLQGPGTAPGCWLLAALSLTRLPFGHPSSLWAAAPGHLGPAPGWG